MRTSIKNLFVATLALVTMGTSAFAADGKEKNLTILNQVKNISKIVANGNVEVILVQATNESVKVYDSYYSKNALVQQEDGVLRISSYQKETLTVAVYVRNLSSIEATGNATVKTQGKVSFLGLEVTLKDNATAAINARTIDLYTVVADGANLKLSGSAENHYAVLGANAKLNMEKFNADNSAVNAFNPIIAKIVTVPVHALPMGDEDDFSK